MFIGPVFFAKRGSYVVNNVFVVVVGFFFHLLAALFGLLDEANNNVEAYC